jgi:hypothetical protein
MSANRSSKDGQLTQAAFALVQAINKAADENLPGKLSGIVKIHAGIGVGCVFIPVPGADLFALFGNTWTMYVRINRELDLPFTKNLIKSIATGILSNMASNAAILAVGRKNIQTIAECGRLGVGKCGQIGTESRSSGT